MKKLILIAALVALFSGCADTQSVIDRYVEKRDKAIKLSNKVKCEKDCFKVCDLISNDIDRVDCKANCIKECNYED